jgi:hypothetical protein
MGLLGLCFDDRLPCDDWQPAAPDSFVAHCRSTTSCSSTIADFLGACRSCKAWAEKLVGISDDTTLTTADKAKIKEEYGLWEQKTGINAKEGGVGILGIRTRQLMHERRLELLEALRDKPCKPALLCMDSACIN